MTTWRSAVPLPMQRPSGAGWLRVAWRGAVLGTVVYGGLLVLLVLRLIEAPLFGARRPLTPHLTRAICRATFPILGIGYRVRGQPMRQIGAVVANHAGWLDIFALNACQSVYFVAKAEVAGWPGIGWLARANGTVFIRRDPKEAKAQQAVMEARIRAGHHLVFFPEGTSTDGLRVQPFKSTLFAAFYADGLDRVMQIQPVTLIWRAPEGADPRFYGWWADMGFGAHFLHVLAAPRQGAVELVFHDPVAVSAFPSRKALAGHCEAVVRSALPQEFQGFAVDG
ncbi:1-acyl-sn-glycerol-3-phosphate acyltransferase [Rhodobacter veldkampii DSM 11550]|uniref:1-acyl-sn-glycerol-3-phosphate acyltransferase n=1 Tax=Phaeovulum veldkampii DSM 11550 TaxID=1185920 RepID=A0A2T4JMW5_9RHOB|nr:lysophospholipid acyltransferase family protein [Phaeovulum veldkampii]MBK5947416.1 1-acyl-sn-glycerol-3-phosphate acyltransferase [Phaeovulum veldkampii DSM 11550]PTE19259.1 1-acyl-sn-glycerol-3-phosphate acyltransferase [Phaeovulum veldkampii DSM 11550]TDQ62256.1 lyso-ornithine lipid acyltransferase [Phaeovulum veldkampii DSM 11550]